MNCRHIWLICFLFVYEVPEAFSQEGGYTVTNSSAKELKRAAYRLHIPVEHLKNARKVLQQATDLSRNLDPLPIQQMNNLAQLWLQFDRRKAPATIDFFLTAVRSAAEKSPDLAAYQQNCYAYQNLLQPLIELDFDKARQLGQDFPVPPPSLGESAAKLRDELMDQFQRSLAQRVIYQDPEKALSLYSGLGQSSTPNYSLRAQLAQQLARSGQMDQANKLVEQVLSDYGKKTADFNSFYDFASSLQQVAAIDPDSFLSGLNLIVDPARQPVPPNANGATISFGGETVQLDPLQLRLIDLLRCLGGRPELTLKALSAMPDLQKKLQAVGGIDNVLNPGTSGGSVSISYAGSPSFVGPSGPVSSDKLSTLFNKLKGKAITSPGYVRQKLSEAANGAEGVAFLINMAQRANFEDPDLASQALEAATPLVSQVMPLSTRAQVLQNLIRAYRNCEGEVDTDLLRQGFILADQLRQGQLEGNPEGSRSVSSENAPRNLSRMNSAADFLEQSMLAETAYDHFDAAMTYLQPMPNDGIKLAALIRIIESLRQNY